MCENIVMQKPELLAPAGSPEKLRTAFLYGADAVYAGGKDFSLRQYASNFTNDELSDGIRFAHSIGKKVYVTANIFPKNGDFAAAERFFAALEEMGADAVLVTDPGFLKLARRVAPSVKIHISTQANTLNKYTAAFWAEQGASRVVLARELSLYDIAEISRFNPGLEIECFVHGAMCVSYSGRCLLSNYLTERDANRGECVQACRWKYKLTEVNHSGAEAMEIEEDARGAYILNSKDLDLLSELDKLSEAGVSSFKIEGRMKTVYYLATVVNAYRRVIDGSAAAADMEKELTKINHRAYTKGYLYGERDDTLNYSEGQTAGEYEFIAVVLGYKDGVAEIEMRNRFRDGDVLEVLSPADSFLKTFAVHDMLNSDGERITDASLVQQRLYLPVPFRLYKGDILRRR